jgi:ABC-type uncharacterized transport system auxiliary subunit
VNRVRRLTLALAACGAAACTGSLFQSRVAPPTVYALTADSGTTAAGAPADASAPGAAAAGPPIPADLAVLKPRLSPGLETDRIAALYPDRHLDYFADARWSGPLSEVLQSAAERELQARANLRTVSGDASVFASAYWLEIEVTDFQAEYTSAAAAPTVHVHFQARLGNSGDRHILGQFAAGARQPAAENRLTAIVDAFARATDAALAEIVAHVDETLAGTPAAR